jgi:uncharacterized protein YkwD
MLHLRKTFGSTEVVAMVFKHRQRPRPQQDQENEAFLRQLWQYENQARQLEGLPPISWEVWLSWWKWHRKVAQQEGGRA